MNPIVDQAALLALKKRAGLQAILASRLDAQRGFEAKALLKGGISETAIAGGIAYV